MSGKGSHRYLLSSVCFGLIVGLWRDSLSKEGAEQVSDGVWWWGAYYDKGLPKARFPYSREAKKGLREINRIIGASLDPGFKWSAIVMTTGNGTGILPEYSYTGGGLCICCPTELDGPDPRRRLLPLAGVIVIGLPNGWGMFCPRAGMP